MHDPRNTTHDKRALLARDRDPWRTLVSLAVVIQNIFWTEDLAYRVSCLAVERKHAYNLQPTVNMKATAVLLLLLSPICFAGQLYYPPLYWHKDDCRFQSLQRSTENNATKEVFMKVIYSNDGYGMPYGLTIVCPTTFMNNWMEDNPDSFSFYENMWQVDKEGYDKCQVNTKGKPVENRLLLTCDNKEKIKKHSFLFMETWVPEDQAFPKFEKGKHYYFISTSNGEEPVLKTRKVSGKDGSCEKYHMKLHIYVCDLKKEDCVYEFPKCGPPPELYRDMHLIGGKLPAVTQPPPIKTVRNTPQTTEKIVVKHKVKDNPTTLGDAVKKPICDVEEKGTSIHLILNFVLGGVALFMAVVIIILVCGLSDKSKKFETDRPTSAMSNNHGGHIVNAEIVNAEMVRYSDGHVELSPVVLSRTPPTSPSMIIPPYPTLQRIHSQRQNVPSDNAPTDDTSPEQLNMERTPPDHFPLETPPSRSPESPGRAFEFPEQAKAVDSETTSEDQEVPILARQPRL
ncbi:uncharacterized protein LOC114531095 [Dendronephthya gigantea]|uniref:uncharacterized protein LOC114531095 n=1 Tax=Dendronephthya gigantea TaxID=151771 RepID=UPI00106BF2FB|nr:uncharacterized protein LOC114531095 [Dendronephthya gigantea]